MSGNESHSDYNYRKFIGDDDFLAFRSALPVGSEAPDSSVIDIDSGETRHLSDYWKDRDLVIEFGSLT